MTTSHAVEIGIPRNDDDSEPKRVPDLRSKRCSAHRQSGESTTLLSQMLRPGVSNFHGALCAHRWRRSVAPGNAASTRKWLESKAASNNESRKHRRLGADETGS